MINTNGEHYDCETIVNAAGFWADDVARMVNARLPITNMEHHYMVTESIPEIAAHPNELPMIRDMDRDFYMRQEGNGLLVGPWEQDCRAAWNNHMAPWDFGQELFAPDYDRLEPYLEQICESVPVFANAGIKHTVNGAISFAPDARPMIGPLPGVPGYFVACGFLGGIAQAGGIGRSMAQWILDGEPELDLSFIDVARFGDWTSREFARERTFELFPLCYEIIYPQHERSSGRPLRTTPLYRTQLDNGAVMGQAFSWERPLWYAPNGVEAHDEPSFMRPNWWLHVGAENNTVQPTRCVTTLIVDVDGADCWGSEPVFHNDQLVGHVTSGGYGWRINASLAVAWIDSTVREPGTALQVEILGDRRFAKVVAEPLYDPQHSRMMG